MGYFLSFLIYRIYLFYRIYPLYHFYFTVILWPRLVARNSGA